jgi:hypothetical protein
MKIKYNQFFAIVLILLISCGTNDPKTDATAENAPTSSNETQEGLANTDGQ